MQRVVALSAFCFFAGSVLAANPVLWKKEVTNLRQIEIGAPIVDFPECPKKEGNFMNDGYFDTFDKDYPEEFKDKPCHMVSKEARSLVKSAAAYKISNLPFIKGGGREVIVSVIDGKVEAIEFRFLNGHKANFYQALIEKYGKPTKQSVNSYQNGRGQTFEGIEAKWYGRRVTLSYTEYDMERDWGRIEMYSEKFGTALTNQQKGTTQSIKSGL